MAKFKSHNKKRNTALLYEFLVRHISKCLIENKKGKADKAMEISKKYFSSGAPLREELSLFKDVLDTNVKSRESAQKIINSVCEDSNKLNARKLDAEKSRLIKEINYTLNEDNSFYSHKIPNYTVYASIQNLLSDKRNKRKLPTVERAKLEDTIMEYLVREPKDDESQNNLKIDPNYNNAVYKFAVNRFHKKYENKLTERQKKLLTKYSVYLISENKEVMKESLEYEVSKIKKDLNSITDEQITKDDNLKKSINECRRKLSEIKFDEINDETILEVLKYIRLAEEVES